MNHKDILGQGVLIKPNGDRFDVFVGRDRLIYNGRPIFDYQLITKTQIEIRPRFNPGEGNPVVNNESPVKVLLKENYEVDGYWQLIPTKKAEELSESVKPTKKGTTVSTKGSEVKEQEEKKKEEEKKKAEKEERALKNKPISSDDVRKSSRKKSSK